MKSNSYDEMKSLLKRSRTIFEATKKNILKEQEVRKNLAASYRVNGNVITLHGPKAVERQLEEDEKQAFIETLNDFNLTVSKMTEFYPLNLYPNDLEWSGKIKDHDVEFVISLGSTNGIHVNGNMTFMDDDYIELLTNLKQFFEKFKEKWLPLIGIQTGHEK